MARVPTVEKNSNKVKLFRFTLHEIKNFKPMISFHNHVLEVGIIWHFQENNNNFAEISQAGQNEPNVRSFRKF